MVATAGFHALGSAVPGVRAASSSSKVLCTTFGLSGVGELNACLASTGEPNSEVLIELAAALRTSPGAAKENASLPVLLAIALYG